MTDTSPSPIPSAATSGADSPDVPIPPRYWWLKRIALGVLVLFVILGAIRWWWGRMAYRAFQAEVDRIVARGEPIYGEDFDQPFVPDDQNAVTLLKQAADKVSLTKDDRTLLNKLLEGADANEEQTQRLDEIIDANTEAIALVRKGLARPQVDWGYRTPNLNSKPPILMPYDHLAEVVALHALLCHRRQRDAEALNGLRDLLVLGGHVGEVQTLLAALVESKCSGVVATVLPSVLSSPAFIEIVNSGGADTAAEREALLQLLAVLQDEQRFRSNWVRGMQRERWFSHEAIRLVLQDPKSVGPMSFAGHLLLKPTFALDGVGMLRRSSGHVEAAAAPDWQAADRALTAAARDRATEWRGLELLAHFLSMFVSPNFIGVHEKWFQSLAQRRMVAVAVALRLYAMDHGRLPERLEALVPQYLAEVPIDPFSKQGHTFGYDLEVDPPSLTADWGKSAEWAVFPLRFARASSTSTSRTSD